MYLTERVNYMKNFVEKLEAGMKKGNIAMKKNTVETVKKTLYCIAGSGSATWEELTYTGVLCLRMMANKGVSMVDRDLFAKVYCSIMLYCATHLKRQELERFDALTSTVMEECSLGLREFMNNIDSWKVVNTQYQANHLKY